MGRVTGVSMTYADTVREQSPGPAQRAVSGGLTAVSSSPLLLLLFVATLLGGGGGGGPFPLVPLPTPQGGSVSEQSLAGLLRWEVVLVVVVTQLVVLETGARVFVHVDDAFFQVSLVS